MSLQLLEALEDSRAFEATHRFEHLRDFHVPFDRLTGTESTEAPLRMLAERVGKVALVGPSGAGKSSVVASVLGPLAEELDEQVVPLRIPVASLRDDAATDPTAFARHLLETVIRYSSEILTSEERAALNRSAADQISTQGRERNQQFSVGAPKLLLDAGVAAEIRSGAEQFVNEQSGAAIEGSARLVEIFRSHDREPFLILDDTDRWIRVAGKDQIEVANAFFLQIVPLLAREIGCGFVIAVHDRYVDLDSYRETKLLLSRIIDLPMPTDAESAITAILDRRIELADVEARSDELLEPEATQLLAELYRRNRSLRMMLATINRATQLGCTDRVGTISVDLLQTALADLG
jgi:predicted ABC-type transport system involved in lysophospholipase L1 biosynthesis ATPase subunit